MLIDRSDELSVLFERSHALEARLKAGTITMGQRESEVPRGARGAARFVAWGRGRGRELF